MYKATLVTEDDGHTHRIEYRLIPEAIPEAPSPIELPHWLMAHITDIWEFEMQLNKAPDRVRSIRLVREVLNLGLKDAKDIVDAILEIYLQRRAFSV